MQLPKKAKAIIGIILFLAVIFLPVCYAIIREINSNRAEAKVTYPAAEKK